MALMHVFCLFCSVRFGTLCITVVTLIHGIASLIFLALSFRNIEHTSSLLSKVFNDLKGKDTFVKKIIEHLELCLIIATAYFMLLCAASALAVFGTIKCRRKMLYPFIFLYGVYLLILLGYNAILLLHFRQNDGSLGIFILYCNIGGLVLLYFVYKWFCVISFIQILKRITDDLEKKREIAEMKALSLSLSLKSNALTTVHHY